MADSLKSLFNQTNTSHSTFLVWDADGIPPKGPWSRIMWRGFNEADESDVISIPKFIEDNADTLRTCYLEWIYDLGEVRVKGKRLIDHFAFEDGLSYWWMTLFVEKSPYKSPISEAIRLLALEEIIMGLKQKHSKVLLVSSNRILHQTISEMCVRLGIGYLWNHRIVDKRLFCIRNIYDQLPQSLRALISLMRHIVTRWPLKRLEKPKWFDGDNAIFLCSYFFNLDQNSCSKGNFYSRQWEILPMFLHKSGFRTNWIQHYLKSNVVPNTRLAMNWINRFNENPCEHGFHTFLDTFLSWPIILRVFRRWLNLLKISLRIGSMHKAFRPRDSEISFWPLMRKDWYASMCGPVAVHNLLWIELFDTAMHALPHQRLGLYLCENQSWERAFIHAWRKHGHGKLIAVVHATVRFWDLRHFAHLRVLRSRGKHLIPKPDIVALNGKAAIDVYLQAGNPIDKIAECEALRYLYLGTVKAERPYEPTCEKILVLGGVMAKSTNKLLRMLEDTSHVLPNTFIYTFKPHPNCMIRTEDYPSLKLKVVNDSLGNIVRNFDIAYASNSTSAAVDAYLAGLSVVVMLDENELNLSPLRGESGVRFVSTPEELTAAFSAAKENGVRASSREEFFFLDPKLPRWRTLLF